MLLQIWYNNEYALQFSRGSTSFNLLCKQVDAINISIPERQPYQQKARPLRKTTIPTGSQVVHVECCRAWSSGSMLNGRETFHWIWIPSLLIHMNFPLNLNSWFTNPYDFSMCKRWTLTSWCFGSEDPFFQPWERQGLPAMGIPRAKMQQHPSQCRPVIQAIR